MQMRMKREEGANLRIDTENNGPAVNYIRSGIYNSSYLLVIKSLSVEGQLIRTNRGWMFPFSLLTRAPRAF